MQLEEEDFTGQACAWHAGNVGKGFGNVMADLGIGTMGEVASDPGLRAREVTG